ncbi:MAG: hypothetical protein FWD78_12265 [Treponema sp.]|nr:hypothetical protein [Treponema sp.]
MNRNAILNAMEKVAVEIFEDNIDYQRTGKRGMLIVEIRDAKKSEQWDSSCRSFGTVFRDYQYEDELVISNGTNFDALAHGKVAFSRRTGLNSGTNYYQVLGYESFWKGGVISDDNNCICAFAGFSGIDDSEIAEAGIKCYESLKRTGISLKTGGDPDYEEDGAVDDDAGETGEEDADNDEDADSEDLQDSAEPEKPEDKNKSVKAAKKEIPAPRKTVKRRTIKRR